MTNHQKATDFAKRIIRCAKRTKKDECFEHVTKGPVEEGAVILKSDEALWFAERFLWMEEMLKEANGLLDWALLDSGDMDLCREINLLFAKCKERMGKK